MFESIMYDMEQHHFNLIKAISFKNEIIKKLNKELGINTSFKNDDAFKYDVNMLTEKLK